MSRGRGRGRGRGAGGRGRGRGRGAGSRGRGQRNRSGSQRTDVKTCDETVQVTLNIESDIQAFFVGSVSVKQHYDGQMQNRARYAAGMAVLQESGVEIAQNARVRALVAAWARNDFELAESFLKNRDNFGIVEVLKALQLLDSARQARILEKKLRQLQLSKTKVLPKTIGKLKSDIDNLNKIKSPYGSASGAICKHVRQWVRNFTAEELEYYALHFPKDPWKKLADICHFHPQKDFPNLPWFLSYCFGGESPADHIVTLSQNLTAENVNEMLQRLPLPYTHVKAYKGSLNEASKALIAEREQKLDTVLWWYEDLHCSLVDDIIEKRLQSGETVNLPLGKFMERLMTFRKPQYSSVAPLKFLNTLVPLAEKKLKSVSLPLESPILVIGDASSSMGVAIRTSTIIAGILTSICSAKLSFFNGDHWEPEEVPVTVEEVLKLAENTHASGCTANAASLYPFYERKEVVKTIMMVTDEEENTSYKGFRFLDLYKKYCEEVYPAKLLFISFLYNQHAKGQMVDIFRKNDLNPMQTVFNRSQPDLTKLDKLFGILSSETQSFDEEVKIKEDMIKTQGTAKVFSNLNL